MRLASYGVDVASGIVGIPALYAAQDREDAQRDTLELNRRGLAARAGIHTLIEVAAGSYCAVLRGPANLVALPPVTMPPNSFVVGVTAPDIQKRRALR
jgi:hypothetical protein